MLFTNVIESAKQKETKIVAVAVAEDKDVLQAIREAVKENIASFYLFGQQEEIRCLLKEIDPSLLDDDRITISHCETKLVAVEEAVKAVSLGLAHILMKGMVDTASLLKGVLNKEYGLRQEKVLSHVAVFEVEGFNRLLFVTDAAMNIAPNVEQKVGIVRNAVKIANKLTVIQPKVAILAAVEVVNPVMGATIDAALLKEMNSRGEIADCVIDGPLALDNAISLVAAQHKGIESEVAGRADILVVPTIESGNILYKSLVYFAHAKVASIVAGARAPIVLTSRSDSSDAKLYSIALAVCTAS